MAQMSRPTLLDYVRNSLDLEERQKCEAEAEERRRAELRRIEEDTKHERAHEKLFENEPRDYQMPPFPSIFDFKFQCSENCGGECVEERWAKEKWELWRYWRRLRRARLRARREKVARRAFLAKMVAAIEKRELARRKKKFLADCPASMLRILNGNNASDADYLTNL